MFIAVIHALYIFSLFKLHADSISDITDIGMTYPDERVTIFIRFGEYYLFMGISFYLFLGPIRIF